MKLRGLVVLFLAFGCGKVKDADRDAPPAGSDSGGDVDAPPGFPTITGIDVGPGIVDVGKQLALTCNATDPDGDNLVFTWTTTLGTIAGTGATVMLDAKFVDGDAMVTCSVDDGHQGTAMKTATVAISLPRDQLIAYYPFSGNGSDASGAGHDLTIGSSAFTTDRHNAANAAIRIVAGQTGFTLPDAAAFDFGGDYTIALFASCDDVAIARAVLAKGANFGNYTMATLANQNGRGQLAYQTTTGNFSMSLTGNQNSIGANPVHVAVARTGGTMATFINGALVASVANTPPAALNTMPVIVGGGQGQNSWVGTIDEVRFYRRALSQPELQAIAQSQVH